MSPWLNREGKKCFFVLIRSWCPPSHSPSLDSSVPLAVPPGILFLAKPSSKETDCLGWCSLGWRPEVDSWPPLLPSTLPLSCFMQECPVDSLRGISSHPFDWWGKRGLEGGTDMPACGVGSWQSLGEQFCLLSIAALGQCLGLGPLASESPGVCFLPG